MNLFVLDENPRDAAAAHCDQHVVKMILETAQLLSTAHRVIAGDAAEQRFAPLKLYRATHVNHPAARWVRATYGNYRWAQTLGFELCLEYMRRYGREHATTQLMIRLAHPPLGIPVEPREPFAQCVPEPLRRAPEDAVEAYRGYYRAEKLRFARYAKGRAAPGWLVSA